MLMAPATTSMAYNRIVIQSMFLNEDVLPYESLLYTLVKYIVGELKMPMRLL